MNFSRNVFPAFFFRYAQPSGRYSYLEYRAMIQRITLNILNYT